MNLVLVRTFPQTVPTVIIQWYSQLSSIFFTLILVILTFQYESIQSLSDFIMIFLIGFFGAAGVFLMMSSYRMTDHINLGPFHYSAIIFSFFLGWVFLDEVLQTKEIIGTLFILGSSVLIYRK